MYRRWAGRLWAQAAVGAAVLGTVLATSACASSHGSAAGSSQSSPASTTTAPGTSATTPTAVPTTPAAIPPTRATIPPTRASQTFSAPHILCESGAVRHSYVASAGHPPELCLVAGAVATIRIATGPTTWPRPVLAGAKSLRIESMAATRGTTTLTVRATHAGVARIVAPPARWTLTVAVIS